MLMIVGRGVSSPEQSLYPNEYPGEKVRHNSLLLVKVTITALILAAFGWKLGSGAVSHVLLPAVLEIAIVAFGVRGVAPASALAASPTFGFILVGISLFGSVIWMFDDQRLRVHS